MFKSDMLLNVLMVLSLQVQGQDYKTSDITFFINLKSALNTNFILSPAQSL